MIKDFSIGTIMEDSVYKIWIKIKQQKKLTQLPDFGEMLPQINIYNLNLKICASIIIFRKRNVYNLSSRHVLIFYLWYITYFFKEVTFKNDNKNEQCENLNAFIYWQIV